MNRAFGTIVEMGRCLLIQAKLPKKYWAIALDTAMHNQNLTVMQIATKERILSIFSLGKQ